MLERINNAVWGGGVLFLLIATGLYITIRTRFFQFTHLSAAFKNTVGEMFRGKKRSGVSPFAAMSAALSGTLGTGNIAGVGAALIIGGAGALFWMWISAFLCMILKFAEVALSVHFRQTQRDGTVIGGPMYMIKQGLPKFTPLAVIFCIATVFASFGIGNAAQVNAAAVALHETLHIPSIVTGAAFAALSLPALFGGAKRLTKITSYFMPFITLFYLIGCVIVLVKFRDMILPTLGNIISDGLNFESAAGGVLGFGVSRAMRVGVSRGIFTNEAGMGSAPIVHASADNTPVGQGYWGIFEVFVDTIIMCSLTGLVILCTGVSSDTASGLTLTANAFELVFGSMGSVFVAISLALFAFGACISWCYYGSCCCSFLCDKKSVNNAYKILFACVMVFGAVLSSDAVFLVSDLFNAMMAFPNLLALWMLTPVLIKIIKNA